MDSTQVISTLAVCPYCEKKTMMRSNINNNVIDITSPNKEISILLFTPCGAMGKECPKHPEVMRLDLQHVIESRIRTILAANMEYMSYMNNIDHGILKYVCYHIDIDSGEYTQRIDMSFIDNAPPEYS